MENYYKTVTASMRRLPFYVTAIGCQEHQEDVNRPSGSTFCQFSVCRAGCGIFHNIQGEHRIMPGDLFYFQNGVPHSYSALTQPWRVEWILFEGKGIRDIFHVFGLGNSGVLKQPDLSYFLACYQSIYQCEQQLGIREYESAVFLYQLILEVSKQNTDKRQFKAIRQQLEPVLTYIEQNFAHDISLNDMANCTNLSIYALCREFQKAFGMSPVTFLNQYRIQKAKEHLVHGEKIKDTASLCGFHSPSYFCAVFKKVEGISTRQFCENYR